MLFFSFFLLLVSLIVDSSYILASATAGNIKDLRCCKL
jgi:hypothetical protein